MNDYINIWYNNKKKSIKSVKIFILLNLHFEKSQKKGS